MDNSRPRQARRPMVPLAAAATVVPAAPPQPAPRPPRFDAPLGSLVLASAVLLGAFVVNSPVRGLVGFDHGWAWGLLGFWGELGSLLAVLGMLFRQPVLAWFGAGSFFAVALMLTGVVWAGHLLALALLGAVVFWQLRRQARADRERRSGWMPA